MKIGKRLKAYFILLAAALCVSGCAGVKAADHEEANVKEEKIRLNDWKEELPQNTEAGGLVANAIRGLSVSRNGSEVFAVSYEPKEYKETFDYWNISIPYQSLVSVNTEKLYELFGTIALAPWSEANGISLQDAGIAKGGTSIFIAYDADQKEDQKGQPEPTQCKIILVGKEDGNGNYYVAMDGSDKVFVTDKVLIDAVLDTDPYQYILKIPALVSLNSVSKVEISGQDETHVLEKGDASYRMDGKKTQEKKFRECYADLLDVTLIGELPEDAKLKKDRKPCLTLRFFRNSKEASDVEVAYYPYDEEKMSVRVNGMEKFFVDKENIDKLQQKIEESF